MINKDDLKNQLTIEQVFDLVEELGGEPRWSQTNEIFVSRTICHNPACCGSHKLYYYNNTKLFKCFTECAGDAFDIYELVRKQKSINDHKAWGLPQAISFIGRYYGIALDFQEETEDNILEDWKVLKTYNKISEEVIKQNQNIEVKVITEDILKNFPHPRIAPWEREGISREVMELRGICYDPVKEGIIIPHYNYDNQLIGIRERTLIRDEEVNGKYKPAIINGQMYNHPLGFNLYNLNNSKDNISKMKKAIIFEGEKSSLLYASIFGVENDISVAVCGSSLISYQVELLKKFGAEELVIAFDKQFQEPDDKEWKQWTKKLLEINNKYHNMIKVSFIFDKKNLLDYKDSPIDKGKDVFLQLFKERIII